MDTEEFLINLHFHQIFIIPLLDAHVPHEMERNRVIRKADWICNLIPIWCKFDKPVGPRKCNESGNQLLGECTSSFTEMICLFPLYSWGGNHETDMFWYKGEIWSLSFHCFHTCRQWMKFDFFILVQVMACCKSSFFPVYKHLYTLLWKLRERWIITV